MNHMVSVDVKHHHEKKKLASELRSRVNKEVCLGLSFPIPFSPSVPNKPYGLCGRKANGEEMNKEEGVPLG